MLTVGSMKYVMWVHALIYVKFYNVLQVYTVIKVNVFHKNPAAPITTASRVKHARVDFVGIVVQQ